MRCAVPVLIQVALCSFALAAGDSLGDLQSTYQSQLDKITSAGSDAMTALGDQVLTALTKAEDAAKQANDPAAKDIAKEIERWKTEGEPPAVESSIPAIAKIHQVYLAQKKVKATERSKQVVAWFRSYDGRLAELKGAAPDEIKAERERISDSFLVKEALKSVPAGAPPGDTAAKPAPPASTFTPAPTGPWESLGKLKGTVKADNEWVAKALEEKQNFSFRGKEYRARDYLYLHGGGTMTYTLKAPITAFKATACMPGSGNVIFIISTDAGEVFRTKPLTHDNDAELIDITFKPTTKLVIRSDPNGDAGGDWAHLLEAKYR
jgi:hypothetical protein